MVTPGLLVVQGIQVEVHVISPSCNGLFKSEHLAVIKGFTRDNTDTGREKVAIRR